MYVGHFDSLTDLSNYYSHNDIYYLFKHCIVVNIHDLIYCIFIIILYIIFSSFFILVRHFYFNFPCSLIIMEALCFFLLR